MDGVHGQDEKSWRKGAAMTDSLTESEGLRELTIDEDGGAVAVDKSP